MDTEVHIHEQDLEVIQKLRIFDDDFMKEVFDGNMEATELVLNVVFGRDDIKVIKEMEGGNEHMCKLFEDMRNEAAKEASITASIDTARFYGIADEKILGDIMKRFGLTERVAKDYLLKVIA